MNETSSMMVKQMSFELHAERAQSLSSQFVLTHGAMLQRKCACGGSSGLSGSCSECEKKKFVGQPLQTKLHINEPGDACEHEADRVADKVVRMADSQTLTDTLQPAGALPALRHTRENGTEAREAPSIIHEVLSSSGRPLDRDTRDFFQPRFGHDFSNVRVHSDGTAEQSAREVNAHAYTVGNAIVFGAGRFAPGTQQGQRLMAHELAHVRQQSGSTAGLLQRSPDEKKTEEKPSAKFVGCDKDRLPAVEGAIKNAEALASRAVQAFEREYPLTHEEAARRAHFGSLGSDQKSTIIERYKHVMSNLGGKTYACAKDNKKVKEGDEVVDTCGQAACPGNNITLFPVFGTETCPAGPVMLHEAIHNAGACDDINKGKSYPPSSSENNAYSYEYFALDVIAGYKTPELGKRRPSVPKVK
jgi:hypothetical protein